LSHFHRGNFVGRVDFECSESRTSNGTQHLKGFIYILKEAIMKRKVGRPKGSVNGKKPGGIHICGNSVKKYRIRSFLTQNGFSRKLKFSTRSLQRIEQDPTYKISMKMAYRIASYMIENPLSEKDEQVWNLIKSWNKEELDV
jgi:DNA-binding XRE family transcriptional regulator